MTGSRNTVAKRILIALAVVVVVLVAAAVWYVNDFYHADNVALAVVADEDGNADGVDVRTLPSSDIAFVPDQPVAGLVFYPGAKVQPEAYAPLMQKCAQRGILCVLLKPTFNLAIIDMNAADGATEQFPNVSTWIIAGHSMGGVAAADYASRHIDEFDAIAFLAAYPAVDLSKFDGKALSIIGSNDGVLNRDKYEQAHELLPNSAQELVIEGGNHANYGNYGDQANDGQTPCPGPHCPGHAAHLTAQQHSVHTVPESLRPGGEGYRLQGPGSAAP